MPLIIFRLNPIADDENDNKTIFISFVKQRIVVPQANIIQIWTFLKKNKLKIFNIQVEYLFT